MSTSCEGWRKNISTAKLAVEDSVPEVLDVGAYRVSCQNVRRLLADKHQETATKLLDLVARKTGDNATDASGEFQKIMDRARAASFRVDTPSTRLASDEGSFLSAAGESGPPRLDSGTSTRPRGPLLEMATSVDGVTRRRSTARLAPREHIQSHTG